MATNPREHKLVAKVEDRKQGMSIDDMRKLIQDADQFGIPGDTPLTEVRVTLGGRMHSVTVKAVPR